MLRRRLVMLLSVRLACTYPPMDPTRVLKLVCEPKIRTVHVLPTGVSVRVRLVDASGCRDILKSKSLKWA